MQGNFSYHNPTKLYFGDESLNYLKDELNNFGPVVLLAILKEAGKTIVENPGVMSNPTLEKLHEGIKIARENNVDLILALGGGSVCDYSKAVAASVFYDGDYWDKFWLKQEQMVLMYVVTTMHAKLKHTGSIIEMYLKCVLEKRNLIKDLYFDSRKT